MIKAFGILNSSMGTDENYDRFLEDSRCLGREEVYESNWIVTSYLDAKRYWYRRRFIFLKVKVVL